MAKWRLLLTTLPYVAAALFLKLVVGPTLGLANLVEFSEVGMVLTGGVFLVGFMLSGTLSDYKEAERLPGEVAAILETLEELFVQASFGPKEIDLGKGRRAVADMGEAIWQWLHRKREHKQLFVALEQLGDNIMELERRGASPHATRGLRELHNLRKCLTRMGVISRTGFVAAGYALLEGLTAAILVMTLIAHFNNKATEIVLTAFITLVFVYMVRLIRDLDDPFEYDENGAVGSVEVELFPLAEYLERVKARVSAKPATTPVAASSAAVRDAKQATEAELESEAESESASRGNDA